MMNDINFNVHKCYNDKWDENYDSFDCLLFHSMGFETKSCVTSTITQFTVVFSTPATLPWRA